MTSDNKNPTRPQADEPRKDERTDRSNQGKFEREDPDRNKKPDVQKLGKAH